MKPESRFRKMIILMGVILVAGVGVAALIWVIPAAAARHNVQDNAVVWLDGPAGSIAPGEEITVSVRISDVVGLYGIQFTLNFIPADLQVVDADLGAAGVQITPADCPKPDLLVKNVVSNTVGTIEYVVSQWNPTPPFSGDCDVAHIRFQAARETLTTVVFTDTVLSDKNFAEIPADTIPLVLGGYKVYLPLSIKD